MGFFERIFRKKNTQNIEEHIRNDQKRCTNCNRLLSEYTEKEICHSCEEQNTS